MGKQLGDPDDPLLVSVRSGAKFSMPGMMETVLNVGLNDDSVHGPGRRRPATTRFAWDSYRRLIQMFGKTVLRRAGRAVRAGPRRGQARQGHHRRPRPGRRRPARSWSTAFKKIFAEHTGRDFPQDPREQLDLAIRAVFDSWNADRAVLYRRQERIPADLGTAVNVCSMVFGNLGPDSGTGVAFTRDPATRRAGRLRRLPAERPGRGRRRRHPQHRAAGRSWSSSTRRSYDQLMQIMATLETHYRDLCDIEFTIERGKLWMLQTRVGKRTAAAAFRIATQLVDEGLIDDGRGAAAGQRRAARPADVPALRRRPASLERCSAEGIAASPGAAVGKAVFDSYTAVEVVAARARRSSWSAGRPTPTTWTA